MKKILGLITALAFYIAIFIFVNYKTASNIAFSEYTPYFSVILKGWVTTILLSIVAISMALVIGLLLYFMQESKSYTLKYMAEILKTMAFSTPLLVIAIVSYYYIGNAFNLNDPFVVGAITLGIYMSAYIADVYKAAIESIHINQWQAAKMFGFSKYQTYRYIIFPQVFKSILPPLAGQFALTVKGTSLLSYMGMAELFNSVNQISATTFQISTGFIIMTLGYWIITIPLIIMIRRLEKKVNYTV